MTDQPDLPPELLERVALAMANEDARQVDCPILASVDEFRSDKDRDNYMERARAVAPLLIAHGRELEKAANYKTFTDGMEAAAQICGSLAETTYDDADAFEAATGCEASIMAVVKDQRKEQRSEP